MALVDCVGIGIGIETDAETDPDSDSDPEVGLVGVFSEQAA
jgi:hypothetical protein